MVIERLRLWLRARPQRLQQWLWFVLLWLAGLLAVTVLAWPLRWLVRVSSGH